MTSCTVTLHSVGKTFNRRTVFRDIDAQVTSPGSLAITGKNGSGKSTLAKIIAGVLSPTSGALDVKVDDVSVPREGRHRVLGFVAPYFMLYDEFTAAENIRILESMRSGKTPQESAIDELLDRVGLLSRKNDRVGTYSSGMKQRVKYGVALIHRPSILILDEPTSNLDDDGTAFVRTVVESQSRDAIVIVATNESQEADWCSNRIVLGR